MVLTFIPCETSWSDKVSKRRSPMNRSTLWWNLALLWPWTSPVPQNSCGISSRRTARQNADTSAVEVAESIIDGFRGKTLVETGARKVSELRDTEFCVLKFVDIEVFDCCGWGSIRGLESSRATWHHCRLRKLIWGWERTYRAIMFKKNFIRASTVLYLQLLN